MKNLNFSEVVKNIKEDSWKFFQNDPILSAIEKDEEKIGAFIAVVVGQYAPKSIDNMRKIGKALDKLEQNKVEVELADDEFNLLKQAWNELAGGFAARARDIVLPICDYLDEVAK